MTNYGDKSKGGAPGASHNDIRSLKSTSSHSRLKYVPPHVRLYQARHKVKPKDLQQDPVVRIELIDKEDTNLLSYSVPFIDSKRDRVFSHCSSIFSLQSSSSAGTSTTSVSSAVSSSGCHDDEFFLEPDLLTMLERDVSAESMGFFVDDKSDADMLKTSTETIGRLSALPPRSPSEEAKYKQEIAALNSRIQRSEIRRQSHIEHCRKSFWKRCEMVTKQWDQIMLMQRNVWLIEIRRRNLQWDGIPWQFKNDIYNLCLWDLPPITKTNISSFEYLQKTMKQLFFERTEQIIANLYKTSNWCKGLKPRNLTVLIENILKKRHPSLYIHLTESLSLDLWTDFFLPLPFYALANGIYNKPKDFQTYEERLLCLFDGLIIAAYYNECDEVWCQFTQYIINQNYFKFFGNKDEVSHEIVSVQLDIHGLLEAITASPS